MRLIDAKHLFSAVPEFNGKGSIDGWIGTAEAICACLADPHNRKIVIVGRLCGSASVWLQSKGQEWSSWSYDHFCAELRRHFQSN